MQKEQDFKEIILIERFGVAIKVDDDEKIIFTYDIENDEPQWHTEGKLSEVCEEMGTIIEEHYGIILTDYGVWIIEDICDVNIESMNSVNYHG